MTIIHQPWFQTLYPILIFGLGFLSGKFVCREWDDVDHSYRTGWDAGRDAAYVEIRTTVQEVLNELDAPNVLINRRTPAFFKHQAD